MLTVLDNVPDGLLDLTAEQLHTRLPGPTLLHLPGRIAEPVFISVLLHGNETTGWNALRAVLRAYRGHDLPGSVSILIGNVAAARYGKRHLPDQPDYNRVWKDGGSAEARMMRQVIDEMARRRVRLSLDIHNTTGRNPHYACVNRLDAPFLGLAGLFSRIVVYFHQPDSVQCMAFSRLCPSVTVECGQVGDVSGVDHARRFIESVFSLEGAAPDRAADLDLFQTRVRVRVPVDQDFGFGPGHALSLDPDIERLNFTELASPQHIATTTRPGGMPLEVLDDAGNDVAAAYLHRDGDAIHLLRGVVPAMITSNPEIVRQDCLCYLMERIPLPVAGEPAR